MQDNLIDVLYAFYKEKNIGYNTLCNECQRFAEEKNKKLINDPLSIYHVGKNYNIKEKRLLLVGLVAYGWSDIIPDFYKFWDDINDEYFIKIRNDLEERVRTLFFNGEGNYFKYLKKSLSKIYGSTEIAYDSIALTNMVHCNTNAVRDNLPQKTRKFCASPDKNGFIHEEIKILNPTPIIILSQQEKYLRYLNGTYLRIKSIKHPSGGISLNDFSKEIENFLD